MDDLDQIMRNRLRALADAVPVSTVPARPVHAVAPASRTLGFEVLLATAAVVTVILLGGLVATRPEPPAAATPGLAGSSGATASPTPPPSSAPPGGAQVRIGLLIEEACPQSEGGTCRYAALLSGPDGVAGNVSLPSGPLAIAPGSYRLQVEARLGTDVVLNGSAGLGALDASCDTTFTVRAGSSVTATAVFRRGSCVFSVDDGSAAASPAATRPAADVALPYPEACPVYGLSPRRCAYIVDWALGGAGVRGQPASIELLGDPVCDGKPAGCVAVRTMAFVVRVRVVSQAGRESDHPVFCGVGGEASMLCSDTPLIRVSGPMGGYHDVPCGSVPGGEPGSHCATPLPTIAPGAAADAEALRVPSVAVVIDHLGSYAIDLGDAVLPNGILSEATATLADDRRADVLIPEGIRLEVLGPDGKPLENAYAQGWQKGIETVHVRLVFTVESFDPGASIAITDIVVR